jgi:hypothetical protein
LLPALSFEAGLHPAADPKCRLHVVSRTTVQYHPPVRNKMPLRKILLAGAVLAAATPASAANFAMMSGCGEDPSDKSCTSIYINGKIEAGDHSKWKALLETTTTAHAIVALNSPGGSLPDGLLIAYDILNREYDTYHSEGICFSACALIWLAGKTRYMSHVVRSKTRVSPVQRRRPARKYEEVQTRE